MDEYKEVKKEDAKYAVILRASGSDTSVYFYASLEDLQWAMNNSWFDPREATPVKLIDWGIKLSE